MQFEYNVLSPEEAAAREWDGLYKHPALGRNTRVNIDYYRPMNLARQRLMPSADIVPFPQPTTPH